MPRLGGFTALLADIFATADRVDRERSNARAQASDARATLMRAKDIPEQINSEIISLASSCWIRRAIVSYLHALTTLRFARSDPAM
jgi:hypothetical protein